MTSDNGNEEWRPVVGYEGVYSVSNHGRVRREIGGYGTMPGMILNGSIHKDGHLRVGLSVEGKRKSHQVHRLVLVAFIGPPPSPRSECRHWDGVPSNNHIGNLLWGTKTDNMQDSKRHGTSPVGSKHGRSKLTEAEVEIILCLIKRGWTQRRIAEAFCVDSSVIYQINVGKKWKHVARS